jgi:hypothetical protein
MTAIRPDVTMAAAPERFQAKWKPVRVKKMRQIKNLEPRFDSIETEKALGNTDDRIAPIGSTSLKWTCHPANENAPANRGV